MASALPVSRVLGIIRACQCTARLKRTRRLEASRSCAAAATTRLTPTVSAHAHLYVCLRSSRGYMGQLAKRDSILMSCTYVRVLPCVRCAVWLADVYNNWLADGTPVFGQAASMWYPNAKGFCNRTDGGHGKRPSAASLAAEADCIEKHLRAIAVANPQRPLFVPAYGVENYLDMAVEMRARLGSSWETI